MRTTTRSIIGGITVLTATGALVIVPFASVAHAATATWTGGGSDNLWTTAANWGGIAPSAADDLVFPSASGTTSNDYAAATAFNSITIGGGTTLIGNRLTLDGPITAPTGTSTISLDIDVTAARTITVASGTQLTIDGVIDDTGGIVKAGPGTLVLEGVNTYALDTVVNAGTLNVTGSIASSNSLTATDATVRGDGTLPDTAIAANATLAPGAATAGIISTGNLGFVASSGYSVDLNGATVGTQYDQADVTGTVALAGVLSVSLGYVPTTGTSFTLIRNDGADPVTGTFAGLAEGATFTIGAATFTITYAGGTGNDVVVTVAYPTTTTLVSSDLTTTFGDSVTFTASVSPSADAVGGSVEFREGAAVLATAVVNGSGDATFTTSALTAGTHSIRAFYLGQTESDASASGTISQVVSQATTSTTLTASPNPSTSGDAVTLTATVASAAGTPTGTVNFFDGATPLGSGTLSGGEATLTTSSLSVGTHSITAIYAGSTNHATSATSGPISVVVDPPATTTTAATTTTVAATTTTTIAGATTTTSGTGSGAGLPTTGGNALPGMLIAFGVALAGAGAVITSRRRTRA